MTCSEDSKTDKPSRSKATYPMLRTDGLGLAEERLRELPLLILHRLDELRGYRRNGAH